MSSRMVSMRKAVSGLCTDTVQPASLSSRSNRQFSGYLKRIPALSNSATMARRLEERPAGSARADQEALFYPIFRIANRRTTDRSNQARAEFHLPVSGP